MGKLKRNDLDGEDDACELAAYYRLKYGIDNDDLTKSQKQKLSKTLSAGSAERSITTSTVSDFTSLNMDSGSDSEDDVSDKSPRLNLRSSPHTISVDSGLGSMAHSSKIDKHLMTRHSSFIPGQDYNSKLGHTQNGLRSATGPLDKRRSDIAMLTESTPATLQYHYARNGIKLEDDYPVVTSSQDHQCGNVIKEEPEST